MAHLKARLYYFITSTRLFGKNVAGKNALACSDLVSVTKEKRFIALTPDSPESK